MSDTKPPFFTWIEATYTDKEKVPARLVQELQLLKYFGATPAELGEIFNLPVEWVEEFTSGVNPKNKSPN